MKILRLFLFVVLTVYSFAQVTPYSAIKNTAADVAATPIPGNPPPTTLTVSMLGYNSVNDGYGGVFFWSYSATDIASFDVILSNNPTYAAAGRWVRLVGASDSFDAIARNAGTGTNISLFGTTYISNGSIQTASFIDGAQLAYNQRTSFFAGNTDNAASQQFVVDQTPLVVQDIAELLAIPNPPRGQYATVMTGPLSGTWQYCPDELAPDNVATLGTIRRPDSISTDADQGRWMFMAGDRYATTAPDLDALVAANPQIFTSQLLGTNSLAFSTVTVQGERGGILVYDSTSSATNNGWAFPATGGGRWVRQEKLQRPYESRLEWWPIVLNDISSDNGPLIQEAARDLYDTGGGTLLLPDGIITVGSTILWPSKVSLKGTSVGRTVDTLFDSSMTNNTTAADVFEYWGGTVILSKTNSNCPLIEMDTSRSVPNPLFPTNTINGVSLTRWQASVTISGITFHGNNLYQDDWNNTVLKFPNVWDITIHDCNFVRWRGYCIDLFNANGIMMYNLAGLGSSFYGSKGIALHHVADCILNAFMFFGGRGPAIWVSAADGWLNSIQGPGLVGNYDGYGWKQLTNITADVFTTSTNHQFETGDPIVFERTWPSDTLPTGLNEGDTYWVLKISDTTFQISTNAFSGNASPTAVTGIGSLPQDMSVGPGWSTGVYLNSGANNCSIGGFRTDQFYDEGVVIEGASRNSFHGMIVRQTGVVTGSGVVTPRAGTNVCGVRIKISSLYGNAENKWTGGTFTSVYRPFEIESGVSGFSPLNYAVDFSTITDRGNVWANSGTAIQNYLPIGDQNGATATWMWGGLGGNTIAGWIRHGVGAVGVRVSNTGSGAILQLWEPTNSAAMFSAAQASTINTIWGGSSSVTATPKTFVISAEAASGTDVNGSTTRIDLSRPTGSGTGGALSVNGHIPGSTGTAQQTPVEVARIGYPTANRATSLRLYDIESGTLSIVSVTNLTLSDGVLRRYLFLP